MTAIVNNHAAKPVYFFLLETIKLDKRGRKIRHFKSSMAFQSKNFGNIRSAKRFIENKYIFGIVAKYGYEIEEAGKWNGNTFTLVFNKKSKDGTKTLNSSYKLDFVLKRRDKSIQSRQSIDRGLRTISPVLITDIMI